MKRAIVVLMLAFGVSALVAQQQQQGRGAAEPGQGRGQGRGEGRGGATGAPAGGGPGAGPAAFTPPPDLSSFNMKRPRGL